MTQKLVLLSLADRASDDNECWPSVERLMKDTCCGHRHTIFNALKELEKYGYISAKKSPGKVTVYKLVGVQNRHSTSAGNGTSVKSGTSAESGTQPVPKAALPPVPKAAHKPISEPISEPYTPPLVPPNPKTDAAPSAPPDTRRGTRLPENWVLPKSWGNWAVSQGLSESRIREISEVFSDYWHSIPGEKGRKVDWEATWRNWVRREKEKPKRNSTKESRISNYYEQAAIARGDFRNEESTIIDAPAFRIG